MYSSMGSVDRLNVSDYYNLNQVFDTVGTILPLNIIPTEFRQRIRDLEKILIIFQSTLGHVQS